MFWVYLQINQYSEMIDFIHSAFIVSNQTKFARTFIPRKRTNTVKLLKQ